MYKCFSLQTELTIITECFNNIIPVLIRPLSGISHNRNIYRNYIRNESSIEYTQYSLLFNFNTGDITVNGRRER